MSTSMLSTLELQKSKAKPVPGCAELKVSDTLNSVQRKVLDLVVRSCVCQSHGLSLRNLQRKGHSVFFTGSAGTGKSFLLQQIIKALPKEGGL